MLFYNVLKIMSHIVITFLDVNWLTLYPSECQNYQSLSSADRKVTYSGGSQSDSELSLRWYRFEGAAGARMASTCPPISRCNTEYPGWLNGTHPTVAEGGVHIGVCYHSPKGCCWLTTSVKVRNCGSYYVYVLHGYAKSLGNLRFCGSD